METFTIGQAAQAAGVGVETVRFYERRGLIDQPPRPPTGGYRSYPWETVRRIRFIRQAQELGFSLQEAGELLTLRTEDSANAAAVRERVRAKRTEVERKIARLDRLRTALDELLNACPGSGPMAECSIMQALERATWQDESTGDPREP